MKPKSTATPTSLWWAVAITILLLIPLPDEILARRWPALLKAFQDAAHVPVFAVVTMLAFRALRDFRDMAGWRHYLITLLIAVGFGGAIEHIQALIGRDSSWVDLGNDTLGAFAALLFRFANEARARQRHMVHRIGTLSAAALVLISLVPLGWTLTAYVARWNSMPVIWREDLRLQQLFSRLQQGLYPGLVLSELPNDWRQYSLLVVEIRSIAISPLEVTVRVHDATHNREHEDRYNESFHLQPREQRVLRIPFERIRSAPMQREMDMARMRGMAVFQDIQGARQFQVIRIQLVP